MYNQHQLSQISQFDPYAQQYGQYEQPQPQAQEQQGLSVFSFAILALRLLQIAAVAAICSVLLIYFPGIRAVIGAFLLLCVSAAVLATLFLKGDQSLVLLAALGALIVGLIGGGYHAAADLMAQLRSSQYTGWQIGAIVFVVIGCAGLDRFLSKRKAVKAAAVDPYAGYADYPRY